MGRLYEKYKGQGLEVLGINSGDTVQTIKALMRRTPIPYPVLLNGGEVARAYEVRGIPDTYVIDDKGMVRFRQIGYREDGERVFAQVIEPLLKNLKPAVSKGEPVKIPARLKAIVHLYLGIAYANIADAFTKEGYGDQGYYDKAIKELEAGIKIDAQNPQLHLRLGYVYEKKHLREKAVAEYKVVLKLDSKNKLAKDALKRLGAK